jgi:hypothetical protein
MSEDTPPYHPNWKHQDDGWKNTVVYAVISNDGRFKFDPTIYTETAKLWIEQGYVVTTLKPAFCSTKPEELD